MGTISRSNQTKASRSNATQSIGSGGMAQAVKGQLMGQVNSQLTRYSPETGRAERSIIGSGAQTDRPVIASERVAPSKRPVYSIQPVRRMR